MKRRDFLTYTGLGAIGDLALSADGRLIGVAGTGNRAAIIRIDEVDKEGSVKISDVSSTDGKVANFPFAGMPGGQQGGTAAQQRIAHEIATGNLCGRACGTVGVFIFFAHGKPPRR